jgi:hypothetical protein
MNESDITPKNNSTENENQLSNEIEKIKVILTIKQFTCTEPELRKHNFAWINASLIQLPTRNFMVASGISETN